MKSRILIILTIIAAMAMPCGAQINLGRAAKGLASAAKAVTLTDAQMTAYVKEYIDWMDKHNPVLPDDDPYTQRLAKLTEGLTSV